MTREDNIGSFISENKKLVCDYVDTRLEIYKLKAIGFFSRTVGFVFWMIVLLFLIFLLVLFLGLMTGFWLSSLTGSYVAGFGITAGLLLVVVVAVALMRNFLFVNPLVRMLLKWWPLGKPSEPLKEDNHESTK